MNELSPELQAKLEKLGIVFDASTAALGANTKQIKSATAQALQDAIAYKKLINEIKELTKVTAQEADVIAKRIKAEEAATDATEEREKAEKDAADKLNARLKGTAGELSRFATGALSASQSIYGSSQAFAAVIPTLNLVGGTVSVIIDAMGKSLSGVTILGTSLGRAPEAVAAFLDAGSKIAFEQAKIQIENTQRFVETYSKLSKVGVTFGGAIEQMRLSAADAGMSLDSYSKFVVTNIQNLSLLGETSEVGAAKVTSFAKSIAQGDSKLLSMYGSFDELMGAASNYAALQARYGNDVNLNDKTMTASTKEYLYNLRSLSELTGKNADQLAKEAAERANQAAYALRMSELNAAEQANVERTIQLSQVAGGKRAVEFATEYFATNGRVTSEASLEFSQRFPELTRTITQSMEGIHSGSADFNKEQAKLLQDRYPLIKQEAEQYRSLYELQAGALKDHPSLKMMTEVGSSVIAAGNKFKNAIEIVAEIERLRTAKPTPGADAFAGAVTDLEKYKQSIDKRTELQLGATGKLVKELMRLQTEVDKLFSDKFTKAVEVFITGLNKAATALNGFGSRTASPTITGANGKQNLAPETVPPVIPRGGGAPIPMQKDFRGQPIPQAAPAGTSSGNTTLKFKSKESTDGGPADPKIEAIAELISSKYSGVTVTAFDDMWHRINRPGSTHTKGMAADLRIPGLTGAMEAEINKLIANKGKAEIHQNANGAGSHLHVDAFAKGGITNGLSIAGEAGPEAVVPLPDGRSIPVKMDMGDMIDKLDEMIRILGDHRDTSEKILSATM